MKAPVSPATYTARIAGHAALVLCLLAAGCSHVAPYERAKLAHRTMVAEEIAGPGEAHLRAIHEGATGGSLSAHSGCGCN
jgi:hypothetical protein